MFSKTAHLKDRMRALLALAGFLAVLSVFIVILGGYRFWERFDTYQLRFRSVKDLSTGRPVKYGGLDVGRILAIGVDPADPRYIRVDIGLRAGYPLYEGVVGRIAQKGLVGDYYVFLDPIDEPGARLQPGSTLPTVEAVDMSQLAGMIGETLAELRPRIDRMAESLEVVLSGENAAAVRELLAGAPGLLAEMRRSAVQFRTDWTRLSEDGRSAARNADKAITTMRVSVEALRGDLERTLADMRVELKNVGALTGTMNEALRYDQRQLEDILENVERVSGDLKQLTAKLRERPWEMLRPPTEAKR